MERKYKKPDEKKTDKATRDRGDLRRNLINSVFEGLKVEDCLADRGDAKLTPIRQSRNEKCLPRQRKTNIERKVISETKSPKKAIYEDRSQFDRHETNFKVNEKANKDVAKTNNAKKEVKDVTIKIEDPNLEQCPVRITKLKTEMRREDKVKQPFYSMKKYVKVPDRFEGQTRTYLDLEGRKRLREKYTVKLQNSNKNSELPDMIKETSKLFVSDDPDSKKQTDDENDKAKSKSSKHSDKSVAAAAAAKKQAKDLAVQRRPIIKTIRVNNDNRVYKAVTFVDRKSTMPIQIKMPGYFKKAQKPEMKNKMTTMSKVSIQMKQKKKKERRLKRRITSPEVDKRQSPILTEVAKWAPSCLNQHTKPYYEAWVDTTLAAITKCSKNDKLYLEQQNIIKTFKRALEERSLSSDMAYENCNDERYTGKITVRQK